MSKKIWDGDYDINTDWGGKDTDGRPLTGEMVQDVIKSEFKRLDTGKVGYITESDGTVYFSSSKEAFDNEVYMGSVISTQRYSMDLKKDSNNRYIFLSGDASKKFVWYFRTLEIATDNVYAETVSVEYHIENETEGVEKLISTTIDTNEDENNSGYTKVEMNLDEYLTNGKSSIEIVVKGLRTKQERVLQQDFTIVTLDIEDNTDFSKPFGDNFIINTNINCTKGQVFYYEYRFNNEGDFIFDDKSYTGNGYTYGYEKYIDISHLSDGKHTLEYRLYINIGGESAYYTAVQRIEFIKGVNHTFAEPQILIFTTYDSNDTPLADDGNLIIYGVSQYVPYNVKYAVYNTNMSSTNVEFYDITNNTETAPTTATVNKGSFYYYSIQLMQKGNRTIKIICKDIDGNILNNDGRILYVNVATSTLNVSEFNSKLRIDFSSVNKSNDSDKDVWISHVDERGFTNYATFSESFDWSQGWTENGLVISEGCDVVFDYVPFPQQKDLPTVEEANEYVGGDKPYTFEIEFMTQNVTDESAILCNMENDLTTNNCGLLITGSEIKFTTPGGESVSSRFKEGEMNRVAIVIHPDTTKSGVFKGLVELYVNGVMSSIAKYNSNHKFEVYEKDNDGKVSPKRLRFTGAKGADLVVKYIRAYNAVMSPDDAINNYIIYRTNTEDMLRLYNDNNIINEQGAITPDSVLKWGQIPFIIFVGRTVSDELATGDGNKNGYDGDVSLYPDGYVPGEINAEETYWYGTLEDTTDKKKNIDMDVIYYNPLDKTKNFKFVKAYITPQGTSSMYYPKKNYRIYTQKNDDTRMFVSQGENKILELNQMLVSNFGENKEDREYEVFRGTKNKKKRVYSFKDNAQAVKCWCLKADFAETSSSHNTGIARLWGDTLKNSTVTIGNSEYNVFKTNAQYTIEQLYKNNRDEMPDIRTTIDGFPILVFGKRSYNGRIIDGKLVDDPFVFLGKYNFNNDKSTESVFGFCDIDNDPDHSITDESYNYETNEKSAHTHTLDAQLDQYMTCVETLDNGNALANFSSMSQVDESGNAISWDDSWEDAFEFRYPEIPEAPEEKDYKDGDNWVDKEGYEKDLKEFNEVTLPYWKNTHLKPFKHFAEWVYSTRWCDANGNVLESELQAVLDNSGEILDESGNTITTPQELADFRRRKFSKEKWDHLDVWKVAAYYIYIMRFGAVDQVVKNSMLTSEGPFAYNADGAKYGLWDNTDVNSPLYGKYYKWYYINYDNDTIMGVKNDGSLRYGPEITRQDLEGEGSNKTPIYAGYTSTLWNNIERDSDFQDIIKVADKGISKTMTYSKAIEMFDIEQVGKWCERVYNRDADYKYITPYMADWAYTGSDENAENFADKLFMLQGSRAAHRRWWLSRRFNLFDGRWSSGDFASKYIEVKCDYGSIGDKFTAIAGANAYFGYQINNKTFGNGAKDGGATYEYKANEDINWKLYKVINIGDPIAIYGSNDLLELNLQGISKNLSSVAFYFGNNSDLGNKLEKLTLSLTEEDLLSESSYITYANDADGTVGKKTGFEKLKADYPFEITDISVFEDGTYPTVTEPFNANDANSPKFYRIASVSDGDNTVYTYFAKSVGGVRNYACKTLSFDALDKLQSLKMAGYMSISELDLSKNKFINEVDVRYSNVGSINLGDGSRIRDLKVSSKFTALTLRNADNLKLSNIWVDSVPLATDGGKNITEININDSTGLNHSSDFKDFILKWMKSGNISEKKLILRNIKWSNVKLSDLDTISNFLKDGEDGIHALECVITGVIEMGTEKIIGSDLEKFKELSNALGGNLTIRIPYANIILTGNKTEIVAGETTNFTYTLFPDTETILNGGRVDFFFVEESTSDDFKYKDPRTNKFYKEIDNIDEIRRGIQIRKNEATQEVSVITTENVIGKDTNLLLMAYLKYISEEKFDILPLVIKEPTYAVDGVINGMKNVGEKNKSYSYTLSLLTSDQKEPVGSMDVEWSISGYTDGWQAYLKNYEISNNSKTYTITTSDVQPYPTGDLKITAKVVNHEASQSIVPPILREITVEKDIMLIHEDVVLTKENNPIVFDICKKQGWIEDENVMTRVESEAVTDIGSIFANVKSTSGWSFDEFAYFTNVSLASLKEGAFANSDLVSIVLPENITSIGNGAFKNCTKLTNVELNENIQKIPKECFLNCKMLTNFNLPDSIEEICEFSFGGTYIERIISKNTPFIEGNKAILLSVKTSKLNTIENDAFETENWRPNTTTNVLTEITLPISFQISESSSNFTLSKNLRVINIDEESVYLLYKDNMLFADSFGTALARVLPIANENNVLDEVYVELVQRVFPYAFFNCDTVKKVRLGEGLYEYGLGEGAFYGSSLEKVDISDCRDLTGVLPYTFNECKSLTEIVFPQDKKLVEFDANVFSNCLSLKTIELPNTLVECKANGKTSESNTFVSCAIEEMVLPSSLIKTGRLFISKCHNLKKIVFSDNFILGDKQVSDCNQLEEVVLPVFSYSATYYTVKDGDGIIGVFDTIEKAESVLINGYTIEHTVKSVVLNNGLSMAKPTFSKCDKLIHYTFNNKDDNKLIIKNNDILYKIGYKSNEGIVVEQEKEIHAVPCGLSALTIDPDTKIIGGHFTNGNDKITSIIIPDGVHTIKSYAFAKEESTGISEVVLPGSVTSIGEFAFENATKLTKMIVPEKVTRLEVGIFDGCVSLQEVEILGRITFIGRFAFRFCGKLSVMKFYNTDVAPQIEESEFHPFGYRDNTYVGLSSGVQNILYIPYNSVGYYEENTTDTNTLLWMKPLMEKDAKGVTCNFIIKHIELSNEATIVAYDKNGDIITDTEKTLYFVSESGDFVFDSDNTPISTQYNVAKGGFVIDFANKAYQNETISVYSKNEFIEDNLLGSFIASYDKNEYNVGALLSYSPKKTLFSTSLFGMSKNTTVDDSNEIVSLTKKEYEMLISKINQLTDLYNRIK